MYVLLILKSLTRQHKYWSMYDKIMQLCLLCKRHGPEWLFLTAFIDRVEYDTFDILQDEEVKQNNLSSLAIVIRNNCMCIMQSLAYRCHDDWRLYIQNKTTKCALLDLTSKYLSLLIWIAALFTANSMSSHVVASQMQMQHLGWPADEILNKNSGYVNFILVVVWPAG